MRPLPLLIVLLASISLPAADAVPPKGETPPPTDLLGNPADVPTVSKEEADLLMAQGKQAMIESNEPRAHVSSVRLRSARMP